MTEQIEIPGSSEELEAQDIEMEAIVRASSAGLGARKWEDVLTLGETRRLIVLADEGAGTWGHEPEQLQRMKESVAFIESKTDMGNGR